MAKASTAKAWCLHGILRTGGDSAQTQSLGATSSPRPPASLSSQWDMWRASGQGSWSPAHPSQPSTWAAEPEEL